MDVLKWPVFGDYFISETGLGATTFVPLGSLGHLRKSREMKEKDNKAKTSKEKDTAKKEEKKKRKAEKRQRKEERREKRDRKEIAKQEKEKRKETTREKRERERQAKEKASYPSGLPTHPFSWICTSFPPVHTCNLAVG